MTGCSAATSPRVTRCTGRSAASTPGANINDPADDRQLRLPDQMEVNVQARMNMMPLIGQQLDFYVDVLNALALRTVTALGTSDGSTLRRPHGRHGAVPRPPGPELPY